MTPEDEVRNLMNSTRTDAEVSENEWGAFLDRAHRSVATRRAMLVAGAIVLVVVGVAAGAALTDRSVREPEPFSPAGSPETSATTGQSEPSATPTRVTQLAYGYPGPEADPRSVVQVWFLSGEEGDPFLTATYRDVGGGAGIGRAAIQALLAGPEPDEDTLGSSIPPGTTLRDLTIQDRIATIDLSSEFNNTGLGTSYEHLPLAQVVWTLSQFDTVDSVVFEIEGEKVEMYGGHGIVIDEPQKRKDYEDQAPAIVVDFPFPGQHVDTTFMFEGTANVFEANVTWRVIDSENNVLAESFATATCGTGCRGEYKASVDIDVSRQTEATLEVFESSAEDGSPLHRVSVPITIVP